MTLFLTVRCLCVWLLGAEWKAAVTAMLLYDVPIPWVTSIKYLGIIVLVAGAILQIGCAYVNSMHPAMLFKYAEECVRLSLVRSMCLPLPTYCMGSPPVGLQGARTWSMLE